MALLNSRYKSIKLKSIRYRSFQSVDLLAHVYRRHDATGISTGAESTVWYVDRSYLLGFTL
jgi:hypothetical protein